MVYEVVFVKYNIVIGSFEYYLDALVDCNKFNRCMGELFIIREREVE